MLTVQDAEGILAQGERRLEQHIAGLLDFLRGRRHVSPQAFVIGSVEHGRCRGDEALDGRRDGLRRGVQVTERDAVHLGILVGEPALRQ